MWWSVAMAGSLTLSPGDARRIDGTKVELVSVVAEVSAPPPGSDEVPEHYVNLSFEVDGKPLQTGIGPSGPATVEWISGERALVVEASDGQEATVHIEVSGPAKGEGQTLPLVLGKPVDTPFPVQLVELQRSEAADYVELHLRDARGRTTKQTLAYRGDPVAFAWHGRRFELVRVEHPSQVTLRWWEPARTRP